MNDPEEATGRYTAPEATASDDKEEALAPPETTDERDLHQEVKSRELELMYEGGEDREEADACDDDNEAENDPASVLAHVAPAEGSALPTIEICRSSRVRGMAFGRHEALCHIVLL